MVRVQNPTKIKSFVCLIFSRQIFAVKFYRFGLWLRLIFEHPEKSLLRNGFIFLFYSLAQRKCLHNNSKSLMRCLHFKQVSIFSGRSVMAACCLTLTITSCVLLPGCSKQTLLKKPYFQRQIKYLDTVKIKCIDEEKRTT